MLNGVAKGAQDPSSRGLGLIKSGSTTNIRGANTEYAKETDPPHVERFLRLRNGGQASKQQ